MPDAMAKAIFVDRAPTRVYRAVMKTANEVPARIIRYARVSRNGMTASFFLIRIRPMPLL